MRVRGSDLRSAITARCTRLSSLWRGLQGVAGGSVSNQRVMAVAVCSIFYVDQHHPIGRIYPKILFSMFKKRTMARLFTAIRVGGREGGCRLI